MRRTDSQITDPNVLEDILLSNTVCRVGFSDGTRPYIIPMNYGYKDTSIYVHSALEGKKLDLLRDNNRVCVEVTDSIEIVTSEKACGYGTKYRSVICNGTIHQVTESDEKVEALKTIMRQHTGSSDWHIPESAASNVAVLKIEIEEVTGKKSGI